MVQVSPPNTFPAFSCGVVEKDGSFVWLHKTCFVLYAQGSFQKNIPIYKAAVKNNIEVRIDQENYLSPDLYV